MQSSAYVVIQGWMCNELELKGNELLIFAMIYGFSQDGETWFYGSRNYIASTFNISLPTVDKAIDSLESKNLIERVLVDDAKSGRHYEYSVCKETLQGVVKKLYGGSKETLLNNTNNKTNSKNRVLSKDNTTKSGFEFGKQKPKKDSLFTKCVTMIDDFVSQHNCGNPVRSKLISYLNYRLQVKDKPLYANMWKGMLNKLDKLHQEGYGYEPIIDYCLERGYLSFYPPSGCYTDTKEKPWEKGVKSDTYTEEEKRELDRERDEMEARGERVWF